jgi:hypothetical protein
VFDTILAVVCTLGPSRWEVRKRYSEFAQLHSNLKSCGKVAANLPPKKFFGKLSDPVVRKRQEGLHNYIQELLQSATPDQLRLIAAFLQAPKAKSRNQGFDRDDGNVYDGERSSRDGGQSEGMHEGVVEQVGICLRALGGTWLPTCCSLFPLFPCQ